jgi:undecaprenyl diphosphate synthase
MADHNSSKKGIHVALIPDGNRRWAKGKMMPEWYGHYRGAKTMEKFLDWTIEHSDIKTVSIYALSTENLKRSKKELNKLWDVYKSEFDKLRKSKKIRNNRMKIKIIGENMFWRGDVKNAANMLMDTTKQYTRSVLNIMIAYGSHSEILNSVKKIVKRGVSSIKPINDVFIKSLKVSSPVDLIIRTGGQHRLSNFLLFQSAYSEIYFTDTLWPDFSRKEFEKILKWYFKQQKRFGK